MSAINLRLYADQIYGLAGSKLQDIITPEISKDEFITMFKEGQIKYSDIKNKQNLTINPQITINNLTIQNILLNIPNETENFSMNISGLKIEIELFEINEVDIEKIMIKQRKDLIDKFVEYAVKKIENKESSPSFIDSLKETFLNRILNGLKIDINDFEIKIKFNQNIFILKAENVVYSEENGFHIKNISLLYQNIDINNIEKEKNEFIINNFNIDITIETKKQEEEYNKLNINMSSFEYKLTKDILTALNEIKNLIDNTKYKYIYLRKNKLIDYYKPSKPEFKENDNIIEKNKYYNSLWIWAIKTVIKLQKYVGYEKLYLFDLNEFIQSKISKKIIDGDDTISEQKILLPTEINLLKNTKEKVESKVLQGKKGNALSNAFSFFFGGGNQDENKELSEEEKSRLKTVYSETEIIKYLYGKNDDKDDNNNPLKEKIINFLDKVKIMINFEKLELILFNDKDNICIFFIRGIKVDIEKNLEKKNLNIKINDIGCNIGDELFGERKKINENNDLININISEEMKIKINLGFNYIKFNEDILNFFIIFFSDIKLKTKEKIFKEIEYNYEEEEKEKEIKENESNEKIMKNDEEFFNNFSISNIPSFIISNEKNKIIFSVIDYNINKEKIEITYNIKDSFSTILDNYKFIFNMDTKSNKFWINLDTPLKLKLSKESSESIFISFLKLKEKMKQMQKRINNKIQNINNKTDNELYCFNYVIHKKIDIKNFDINKLKVELIFKKIVFEIYENKVKSEFSIHDFNLIYENRDLIIRLEKVSIETNLMSTMIIYLMDFEAPNFDKFYPYIDEIKNKNNKDEIIIQNEEKEDTTKIQYEFNIDYFLNSFNIYINMLVFKIQSDENILEYEFDKIQIKKEIEIILIKINNIGMNYNTEKSQKKNIFNLDKEASISADQKKNLITVNITHPKADINFDILNNIRKSFQYLLEQVDLEIIICKADIKISNANIILADEFNLSISNIAIKNFDGDKMDTLYLNIDEFNIKNKNEEIIMEQKSINIKMITESILKYIFKLSFENFYVNLTKDDINNLFLLLNNSENDNKKFLSQKTKHYIQKPEDKKSHEVTFIIEGEIPLLSLGLCDENRNKKLEIIYSYLNLNCAIFIPAEKNKSIQKNMKLFFKKINIILNEDNGGEYNIIQYNQNIESNLGKKSMIKFGQKSGIKNQFELFLNNENEKKINEIKINFNALGIYLRLDIIYNLIIFLKEFIPKKIKNENNKKDFIENNENKEDLNDIKIYFNEIGIKLEPLNNQIETIFFNINKYSLDLISENELDMTLDKFSISLIKKEEIKNIFESNNNSDFLSVKIKNKNHYINIKTILNEAKCDFAFSDISILKQFINTNNKFIEKNKINLLKEEKENSNNILKEENEMKNKITSLTLTIKKMEFILVDDYSNNYYPFLNFKILNLDSILSDENLIHISTNIILDIYNYISSKWEPIIEESNLRIIYNQEKDDISMSNSAKLELSHLSLNISDMLIGSTLLSMKNLKKSMEIEKLKINGDNMNEIDMNSRFSININSVLSGILINETDFYTQKTQTNNNLINYTGVSFKFKYGNKIYISDVSSEINLETKNKNQKKLIQIYYEQNHTINIPLDGFDSNFYKLNDNEYLVWEKVISKQRQINVIVYSPIIFQNKTNYSFEIKLMNSKLGNLFILLKQNSYAGIPMPYYNNSTTFNIRIINNEIKDNSSIESSIFNFENITQNPKFSKKINIEKYSFMLKTQNTMEKVKTILITSEYKIINCLPCNIIFQADNIEKKIKKCSQFLLDFYDTNSPIKLGIKVGENDIYYSDIIIDNLLAENGINSDKKFLTFKNNKNKSFNLTFIIKIKKHYKCLIIYSDYILYNDSGINFQFGSSALFNIADNIYIISNNINLEEINFAITSKEFDYSDNLNIEDIIKAFPYYKIYLNSGDNNIILPITKKISSIPVRNNPNFKPGILTMIFYILPTCKITNIFANKKFILRDYYNKNNSIIVPPLNQISFNFFNKNRNNLILETALIGVNENKCEAVNNFNSLKTGIYTLFSDNMFYNLEIKDSSSDGLINIFVTEANLKTAKIIIVNKTKINFEISQKRYEQYKQKIKENDIQILKIYDHIYMIFTVEIYGKNIEIKFFPFKEEFETIDIDNKYVLLKESNGVKMIITLYDSNEFNKIQKYENNLSLDLIINKLFISVIGDNFKQNKKLKKYKRDEILLLYINNLESKININQYHEMIHKNHIEFNLIINKFEIYNQLNNKVKFACILKSTKEPFLKFQNDFDFYVTDQIAKINSFNFDIGKYKLNIEPEFVNKIIDFGENVGYRIGKINLNVDKLFLRTDKNIRDISIKNNFQNYIFNQKLICFGFIFNFPSISFDLKLIEEGLETLMTEKFNKSYLFIWVTLGLSKQNQNINIEKIIINNYFGDILGLFQRAQEEYKAKVLYLGPNLIMKGIWGQVKYFFSDKDKEINYLNDDKNRIRYPRAFYGKYFAIKNYNETEAKIIEVINDMYKKDFNDIYCNDIIMSKKYIFYFSEEALYIFTKNYELHYKVEYPIVNNVYNQDENLVIKYRQENDEEDNPPTVIDCDNEALCTKIVKYLKNYLIQI